MSVEDPAVVEVKFMMSVATVVVYIDCLSFLLTAFLCSVRRLFNSYSLFHFYIDPEFFVFLNTLILQILILLNFP